VARSLVILVSEEMMKTLQNCSVGVLKYYSESSMVQESFVMEVLKNIKSSL
jgi:arginyl-tRNA synthetase